ncbi:MAG: hypothetical protein V4520_12075 [Bacteroidota bacterium]
MKNSLYFISAFVWAFLLSCNQGKKEKAIYIDSVTRLSGHPRPDQQCFVALFEKDSANLRLNNAPDGKVTGQLYIKYHEIKEVAFESELNIGKIAGKFKGDTLFANYTFTSGTQNKTVYTNPIALLCKGDTLILGSGVIITYLGRSYFDKKTPLDFQKSRFRFKPVNCKK